MGGDCTRAPSWSGVSVVIDVMWVPKNAATRFIPVDTIFPPVLAILEEQT